jgi:hypothetical protein
MISTSITDTAETSEESIFEGEPYVYSIKKSIIRISNLNLDSNVD